MVTIRSSLLFLIGIMLIGCNMQGIRASDKTPKKPVVTKEPVKDPFDAIAQKLYAIKLPTESDKKTIDTLLKDKESLIGKRPQCKREITLSYQDFEGRKKAADIRRAKIGTQAQRIAAAMKVMQRSRAAGQQVPFVPVGPGMESLVDKADTSPPLTVPTAVPPTQPQVPVVVTSPPSSVTPPVVSVPVSPTSIPEAVFEEFDENEGPAAGEETIIRTPAEVATLISEIENSQNPLVESLALVLPVPFEEQIVQPLQIVAQENPDIQSTVTPVLTTIGSTLLDLLPTVQEPIIKETGHIIKQIIAKPTNTERALVVTEIILPLMKDAEKAVVTFDNFAQLLTKNGMQKGKTIQGIKFTDFATFLYQTAREATLGNQAYPQLIEVLSSTAEAITGTLVKASPTITSALALASTPESIEELSLLFNYLLSFFDALLLGVDTRAYTAGNALVKNLKGYHTATWLAKGTYNLTGTTPGSLVPQLISLYALLKQVGPELIYAIEVFVAKYKTVMNPDIITAWENQGLEIPEYVNSGNKIKHKRDYLTELILKLANLKTEIENGIQDISDKTIQKKLRDQLDELSNQPTISRTKAAFDQQRKENLAAAQTNPNKRLQAFLTSTKDKQKLSSRRKKQRPVPTKPAVSPAATPITEPPVAAIPVQQLKPTTPAPAPKKPGTVPSFVPAQPLALPAPEESAKETTANPVGENKILAALIKELKDVRDDADIATFNRLYEKKTNFVFDDDTVSREQRRQHSVAMLAFDSKYRIAQERKSTKETIDTIQKILAAAIKDKELLSAEAINQISDSLKRAQSILSKPDYTKYEQQIKSQCSQYAQVLIAIIKDNSERLTSLDLGKIAQCVALLSAIQELKPLDLGQSIQDIMVTLCALYDQALHMLYTPQEMGKKLAESEESEASEELNSEEITVEDYLEFVAEIQVKFEPLSEIIEGLCSFIRENEATKFKDGAFNISQFDGKLLKDGNYIYAVSINTPVVIGGKAFNTLHELNANHAKKYNKILEEWKKRIEVNEKVERLQELAKSAIATPEIQAEMQELLADIKDTVPTFFTTDAALQEIVKQVETVEANAALTTALADLLKQIESAITVYNSSKKTITKLDFEKTYTDAQQQIATLDDAGKPFETELKTITQKLSDYLTLIAQGSYANLSGFPSRGFNMDMDLATSIEDVKIHTDFVAMLTQVKNLGLLTESSKQGNPFYQLYLALLHNYGYILATFDAITAKLFDGVQNPKGWVAFIAEAIGYSKTKTQYETSEALINGLLKPIEQKRSLYYEKLIAPYFEAAPEIKDYLNGTLALTTLGLANMATDGKYIYARGQVPDVLKKVLFTQPITGIHMPSQDLTAAKINGGDAQYNAIIKNYETIIGSVLKTEKNESIVQKTTALLDAILDIPFGAPSKKLTWDGMPEFKNKFGTMYLAFSNENIPNVYTALRGTLSDNGYEIESSLQYLDVFFITVAQALENKKIIEYLQELKNTQSLTQEIGDKLKTVVGTSYIILDSIIAWADQNLADRLKDSDRKKLIGGILARYYPTITAIFDSVKQLRSYLPAGNEQIDVKNYITVTQPVQTGQSRDALVPAPIQRLEYPFTIKAPVGALATMTGGLLGSTEPQPVLLLSIPLLQTGMHTNTTIADSLLTLQQLIPKLGGKTKPSVVMQIVKDISPFITLFAEKTVPPAEDIQNATQILEPIFKKIAKTLTQKPSKANNIALVLNDVAQYPIIFYGRLRSQKTEIPQDQQKAFQDLINLFYTTFETVFHSDIAVLLTQIIAWQPLKVPATAGALVPAGVAKPGQKGKLQPTEVKDTAVARTMAAPFTNPTASQMELQTAVKNISNMFTQLEDTPQQTTTELLDDIAQQLMATYREIK